MLFQIFYGNSGIQIIRQTLHIVTLNTYSWIVITEYVTSAKPGEERI